MCAIGALSDASAAPLLTLQKRRAKGEPFSKKRTKDGKSFDGKEVMFWLGSALGG